MEHDRWNRPEKELRYLLLEIEDWPVSFAPLARLWLTAERLARTLDRELVVWNLPCSFSWSGGSMAVTEERELGLAAAVVERTCAISAVRADTTGGIRSGATNDEQQLVRVPERCCTIFWDLSQRRCTRTPTRQHTRDHAHGRMHPPLYPHAPVIPRWYSYLCAHRCAGLGEQLYACTDHIHRSRFEQAIIGASNGAGASPAELPVTTALFVRDVRDERARGARVAHLTVSNASTLARQLEEVQRAAARLANAQTVKYRRYRLTESRGCSPAEVPTVGSNGERAVGICDGPIF